MSGGIPLLLVAFMACTGTTLHLHLLLLLLLLPEINGGEGVAFMSHSEICLK